MKKTLLSALALAGTFALVGCNGSNTFQVNGPLDGQKPLVQVPTDDGDNTPKGPAVPDRCQAGRTYKSIGGAELTKDRAPDDLGIDRGRVKPFEALTAEYSRVLGNSPSLLSGMGPTFGQAPNRWFVEPRGSAISLYTAYRIAFQGCLTYTANDGAYANAPDANSAQQNCIAFAQSFWSRDPSPDELAMCVQTATQDTQVETQPRRKWAYTCAAVLSSAGFLTY